jgi:hypothetical protein
LILPFGEPLQIGKFGADVHGGDERGEEIVEVGRELRAEMLDEADDIPDFHYVSVVRQRSWREQVFQLAYEHLWGLRFQQRDSEAGEQQVPAGEVVLAGFQLPRAGQQRLCLVPFALHDEHGAEIVQPEPDFGMGFAPLRSLVADLS